MKLFRKRKKNNKGFSMVEMICAIAVLSLTSTAIGSVMVMSTKNYQRGNAEVDVQKEAQATTNLIGNLLIDSVDANYDATTKTLKIEGEGIEYLVVYDAANKKLTYKETKLGGTPLSGVLAENVSDFRVDLSKYSTNKNAKIDLGIEKNGKSYDASYNTTARNGSAFNVGAEESAVIVCETELVLEPNQTYDLPVRIYGNPDTDGFNIGSAVLTGPDIGSSSIELDDDDGVKIKVGADASGMFTFVINTNEDDGTNPLDTKTVTVKIRRANSITPTPVISGQEYKNGTTYKIYADVACDYPDKVIGKEYDNNYINPRFVDFEVTAEGGAVYATDEMDVTWVDRDCNRPYYTLTLNGDMPQGSKITVNMRSKHAAGPYYGTVGNKTATAYDNSVVATYVIENTQGAIYPSGWPSGIRRGNDYHVPDNVGHFSTTLNPGQIKTEFGGEPRYMFRYREKNSGDPFTPYQRMVQDSAENRKFNAIETELWAVDKAYEIEVILVSINGYGGSNPTLEYPMDPDLLTELQAYYPNLTQGWTTADLGNSLAATQKAQYSGVLDIGASLMVFKDGGTTYSKIGDETTPGLTLNVDGTKTYDFDGQNLMTSHYGGFYSADIYQRNGTGGWTKITTNPSDHFTVEIGNMQLNIKEIKDLAKGHDYKIVPKMVKTKNTYIKNENWKTVLIPDYGTVETIETKYLNDASGNGCIYLRINN